MLTSTMRLTFFVVGTDPRIITVSLKGSDFTSINAALSYILTFTGSMVPSSDNPLIIKIGPGTFVEDPFTIPGYVRIEGNDPLTTVLLPGSTNTVFVTMTQYSDIRKCALHAPAGVDGVAVRYLGGNPTLQGITLSDIRFVGVNEDSRAMYLTTDFGVSNVVNMNSIVITGKFKHFIDQNNTVGLLSYVQVENMEWFNLATSDLVSEVVVFLMRGNDNGLGVISTTILVNNMVLDDRRAIATEANMIGFELQTTGTIQINSSSIRNCKTAVDMQNAGATQNIIVRNTVISNANTAIATSDVFLQNPNTTGSLQVSIDTKYLHINPSSNVAVNTVNPNDGNTSISGILSLGEGFANVTNASNTIQSSCIVGIYRGAGISSTGALNITVATGSGYLMFGDAFKVCFMGQPVDIDPGR